MRYQNVCLEALAYALPEEIVTSGELEARLAPAYSRLRLPEGRLELMTGVVQRRFWPKGTLPSQPSTLTAAEAIRLAGVDPSQIGALVHGSVCRDVLEPATACRVHGQLGLPRACLVYDVSNACLGLMDGIVQVANMIELGQIRAGVVVGTESSRTLVDNTIRRLNEDPSLTRADVKLAVASLTIGSGSAAVVLVDRRISRTGNRLLGGVAWTRSDSSHLCQSSPDSSIGGEQPLIRTDSEALMHAGIQAAQESFDRFLDVMAWQRDDLDKTFCHQVGKTHRRMLFEALGLDLAIDYSTLPMLGNTGSVALPITAAMGIEQGHLRQGDLVALMGIGSGINVVILALDWQRSPVDRDVAPQAACGLAAGPP
jgi:3-oxoacyl-[acyl-carrier-protein] synthase-3